MPPPRNRGLLSTISPGPPVSRAATAAVRTAAAMKEWRSSFHLKIGLQRARRLDRLQNRNQIARPYPQRIERGNEIAERYAARQDAKLAIMLIVNLDLSPLYGCGGAVGQRSRLADLRRL